MESQAGRRMRGARPRGQRRAISFRRVPRSVTGEISNLVRAGATELNGHCLCCAQWGLSLVITVRAGDLKRTLLFDSGPEGHGVERNGERLQAPFADIGAAVFSHGHWDHVGGMETALRLIAAANGGRPGSGSRQRRNVRSACGPKAWWRRLLAVGRGAEPGKARRRWWRRSISDGSHTDAAGWHVLSERRDPATHGLRERHARPGVARSTAGGQARSLDHLERRRWIGVSGVRRALAPNASVTACSDAEPSPAAHVPAPTRAVRVRSEFDAQFRPDPASWAASRAVAVPHGHAEVIPPGRSMTS